MYNVKGHIKANGFTNHKSANNSLDQRKKLLQYRKRKMLYFD